MFHISLRQIETMLRAKYAETRQPIEEQALRWLRSENEIARGMNVIVKYPSVTVSALLTAPCETLFSIISDPTRHPELAGSGEVMETRWLTPPPVGIGSGFQSRQCVGWYQYPSRSYVQVYEPPYRFVWLSGPGFKRGPLGQLWGFDLKPLDARTTLVSHLMKVPYLPVLAMAPFNNITEHIAQLELKNMQPTLHKLAKLSGAQIIGNLQVVFDWCENTDQAPCTGAENSVIQARPAK